MARRTSSLVAGAAVIVIAVLFAMVWSSRSAASSAPGHGSSATGSPAASIPADVQDQLDRLPAWTVIVPCNPSVAVLPGGVRPETATGFHRAHPGFKFLL